MLCRSRLHRAISTLDQSTVPLKNEAISPGSLEELLMNWLSALEEHGPSLVDELQCSADVLDAIRRSAHDYLRVAAQAEVNRTEEERQHDRMMYNFAYGLSHELNNPLANIAARADQLSREVTHVSQKKSLNTIADSAMRAHEMLSEMMLAVQNPAIVRKTNDLRPLMLELDRQCGEEAIDRRLIWKSAIADEFLRSKFEAQSLREALYSAVRNAFEACRQGDTVEFVVERIESETGQLEIRIAIADSGPGLSLAALDQAWDLYYCGREAGRGLGIGLAKLRRVIEAHQGRVWLRSEPRAGCVVEVRLPIHSEKTGR